MSCRREGRTALIPLDGSGVLRDLADPGGALSNCAATTTTLCPAAGRKTGKSLDSRCRAIMLEIGTSVIADPAPKPAAVRPSRKAAPVGKPFDRVTHGGAVDETRADAAECGTDIEHHERCGDTIQHPGRTDQHAARAYGQFRADPVDHVTLKRQQPSFAQHEHGKGHLDGGAAPAGGVVDRQHEQRPAILQVRNHHHAQDADDQLAPA